MYECIQRFLIIINYFKINVISINDNILNIMNKDNSFQSYYYLYTLYKYNLLSLTQVDKLHNFIGIRYLATNNVKYYKDINNNIYCEYICSSYNYIYILLFFLLVKNIIINNDNLIIFKIYINISIYKIILVFYPIPLKIINYSEDHPWKWIYLNCLGYPYDIIPVIKFPQKKKNLVINYHNIININNFYIDAYIVEWYLHFYPKTSWDRDELDYIYDNWKTTVIKNKKFFIFKYYYLLYHNRLKLNHNNDIYVLFKNIIKLDKYIILNILEFY